MSKILNSRNKKIVLGVILLAVFIGGFYGVYRFHFTPEPADSEPQPETITIIDNTGAYVTVPVPVKRIVCLTHLGMVYLLGSGDRIVGRQELTPEDEKLFPPSILELPVVGTDMDPNLELILELEPCLVLASQRLSEENRKKLENAGVAVIEDTLMWPRRYDNINNLGMILDAEEKATELIEYETYYVELVEERIANLDRDEKPLVFFEWYQPWFSTGPGATYDEMLVAAGGINIAENATVLNPDLSPESVAEKNPDIIIRMLTHFDGEDLESFQRLRTEIMNRPALRETNAVKEGHVYIIHTKVLVGNQVIGLLYIAQWFHPHLFADIDPAAVHEEYNQKFFGTDVSGVFAYP